MVDGEAEAVAELVEVVRRPREFLSDRYRHGVRFAHLKSQSIVQAELAVRDDLPVELPQGPFAVAWAYPVIVRLLTAPGDLMADSRSTPRGIAVK